MKASKVLIGLGVIMMLLCNCSKDQKKTFRLVPSKESGLNFRNQLRETAAFNIFNYMYFYNGGGVAVGDVNGDNLLDIFFTSNQDNDKLYLNLGGLKFRDVTEASGTQGRDKSWTTGVTMADVNADGKLDIYVSCVGDYLMFKNKNQLFINEGNDKNGIPHFTDRAKEFGLDIVGFSTQAAFFDYDIDGDLDMFMLNHSLHQQGTFGRSTLRNNSHPLAGDRLLRNDDGHFVDVTQQAGIYNSVLGYGLGVVVSDFNLDGFPDLYVGNDFHENDYLYVNQKNGTFKERVEEFMPHTSRYTMGVDFADFNNDIFPDLISMDMLPNDPLILKSSMAEDPYEVYNFKLKYGYNHQFARNTLQLNNHNNTFSDIAVQSGVYATDWSWAAFFADFDLDGNKDIFVANGIARRSNDLDYINFIEVDSIQHRLSGKMGQRELGYIKKMPQIKVANFLFRNNGDSTFSNKALEWGLEQPSYSNGAAYADLDNDGDLDLVINNIEDEAMLYANETVHGEKHAGNFLQLSLQGLRGNRLGIGAKVLIYDSARVQMQECMPTRGFQSSVDYRLTFGLGNRSNVDSLIVIWPAGGYESIKSPAINQMLVLDQRNATLRFDYSRFHPTATYFESATDAIAIDYRHRENVFAEFDKEQLIPHMLSSEGPAAAMGDVDGDGREDIFLGGGKRQPSKIFMQTKNGKFSEADQPVLFQDSVYEDVDASFFDADADKDLDLFVVSGGNEYFGESQFMKPRLYINDGKGNFTSARAMPDIFSTGSCVSPNDFDGDGDIDIFLGARTTPGHYGQKPDSYVLENDGTGNFNDITERHAPALKKFGFVKDATWADIDKDGDDDLLIAAEWSPITIFINNEGYFAPISIEESGLEFTNGWWNTVQAFDFDKDGDLDLVAGNLGLNSKLKASRTEPVRMYVADFDQNGNADPVVAHFVKGEEYPFYTRDEMTKQLPYLKKRYLSYRNFAEATLDEIFPKNQLKDADKYEVYTFETSYIENLGGGKFKVRPLPRAVQVSTVESLLIDDYNQDGMMDMLVAGNFFPVNAQRGRYDASYGWLLLGNGRGEFKAVPAHESGFSVAGETRALRKVKIANRDFYVAVRNNEKCELFTLKR